MNNAVPTTPELHVDLDACLQNYNWFCQQSSGAQTSAAIKADAYGLGMAKIAPILQTAGCKTFFVAHIKEAVSLRKVLTQQATIYVLHGCNSIDATVFHDHNLRPVINSDNQLLNWLRNGNDMPCALHVDTGINRLGIAFDKIKLSNTKNLNLSLLMSHLACASTPDHKQNPLQLQRFKQVIEQFPDTPCSLANSAGVLLGSDYHFSMTRPGIGLYGGTPFDAGISAPQLTPVARLRAPVLQVKSLKAGDAVGYGGRFIADKPMKIAIISYGYADGLFRSAGVGANCWINGQAAPLLGQVSMDLMAVDLSNLDHRVNPNDFVEFLGYDLNDFSRACSTIPYEVLTSIGTRVSRIYHGAN
ncbi:MAG: alanine racemase [Robiginitomaculum sp.]|nr:alanine racemase [Robiginitomaculum sp.]